MAAHLAGRGQKWAHEGPENIGVSQPTHPALERCRPLPLTELGSSLFLLLN